LQHETGVTRTVDPLGGSYYVESLTEALAEQAWAMIEEIEAHGGMTKAVIEGLPKRNIEEAAARRQARVDGGDDVIVGVNRFQLEDEPPVDSLHIDNDKVRRQQVERLSQVRSSRNQKACDESLQQLTKAAEQGSGNLLEYAVEAARCRATLGEISDALETAFGRHQATTRVISGVYADEFSNVTELNVIKDRVKEVADTRGRAPYMLVAKMGQDGHDRGAKVIASSFSDIGFKIDVSDLFMTPEEVVEKCKTLPVDVIGVSSLAAGHLTLIPQLIELLNENGLSDIKVVCGGVIPEKDYQALLDAGVAEIFGPGTSIIDSANAVLGQIVGDRRNR
jgi:methylmalonyl-CoA mutase